MDLLRNFGIRISRLSWNGWTQLIYSVGSGAPTDTPVNAQFLVDNGTWFVGDPDQVVEQIVEQNKLSGGFGVMLQMGFDYADPGARGWMRSMELLSTEVMPRVNRALGQTG